MIENFEDTIIVLTASLITQDPCTIIYSDRSDVTSIRYARVLSIEHCRNQQTIARVYDLQRKAPRSFRLTGIRAVYVGERDIELTPIDGSALGVMLGVKGAIQAEPYTPQLGDRVIFRYTKLPHRAAVNNDTSQPFTWAETGPDTAERMRRDGWEFTIENTA